jgi:hypothetical protein
MEGLWNSCLIYKKSKAFTRGASERELTPKSIGSINRFKKVFSALVIKNTGDLIKNSITSD